MSTSQKCKSLIFKETRKILYAIATFKLQLSPRARARKLISHHLNNPTLILTLSGHERVSAWAKQTDSDVVKLWVMKGQSYAVAWPVTCTWARAKALGLG